MCVVTALPRPTRCSTAVSEIVVRSQRSQRVSLTSIRLLEGYRVFSRDPLSLLRMVIGRSTRSDIGDKALLCPQAGLELDADLAYTSMLEQKRVDP